MANTYTNLDDLFTDMANAIREKKDSTATIIADNFPTEIDSLRTGFDYNNQDVTEIPDRAFYGCEALNSVNCVNLTSIGAHAFEGCKNLKSVTLYESVEYVGKDAFRGCDNLIIFYKGEEIPEAWDDDWNSNFLPIIYGELVATYDISATSADNVIAKIYVINDKHSMLVSGTGHMKDFDDYYSVPSEIKHINECIVISEGITRIGAQNFCYFDSLKSLFIPSSLESVGTRWSAAGGSGVIFNFHIKDLLSWCKVVKESNITNVNNLYVNNIKIEHLVVPRNITSIDNGTFANLPIVSAIIPNTVTYIGQNAFLNSLLTSIKIPDSVIHIDENAFYGCSRLSLIDMSNNIETIKSWAFTGCNFTHIDLPNSVSFIGTWALPYSITSINYTGTIAQWNVIEKEEYWDSRNEFDHYPDRIIHCTDGDIAQDGTITYH